MKLTESKLRSIIREEIISEGIQQSAQIAVKDILTDYKQDPYVHPNIVESNREGVVIDMGKQNEFRVEMKKEQLRPPGHHINMKLYYSGDNMPIASKRVDNVSNYDEISSVMFEFVKRIKRHEKKIRDNNPLN